MTKKAQTLVCLLLAGLLGLYLYSWYIGKRDTSDGVISMIWQDHPDPPSNQRNVSDDGTFMPNTLRDGFPSSNPRMPAPVTAKAPEDGSWSSPTNMPSVGPFYPVYPQYHRNGAMELRYKLRDGTEKPMPISDKDEDLLFMPSNVISFRVRNPGGKTLAQLTYEDAEKQKLLHPGTAPADDPWTLPQRYLTLTFTDIPPAWPATK